VTEPKKRKAFSIQEKMDILAQVDANKEARVSLAARLGIAPSTLSTIVKAGKTLKSVTLSVAGSLVKGRA
jgi:transposase-like protein